jgi:alpha-glucosidase/alpha-D-xyloside xylohydrolase
MPLIRSLGLAFPEDPTAWATADAYLWGPSLLAAPVFEQGATQRKAYLPAGEWYDYWSSKPVEGGKQVTAEAPLETMPLFVRAGTILPRGPVKQYVDEPSTEPVKLTIYPGADGQFQLYDDDGVSFAYEQGMFTLVDLKWNDAARTLEYTLASRGPLAARTLLVSVLNGPARRIVPVRGSQKIKL